MARITIEDCLEKVPNRFALVMLAVKRTKQLLAGSNRMVSSDNKDIITSLRELAAGRVIAIQPPPKKPSKKAPKLVPVTPVEDEG
ncbi:MAG: DNA-directed RNA polymerase subunit omega [Deltaproteobacteria bacterium RBG_13_61_14]|nr:MAG: DNA-directed RNA polymerase subunit omega [Deltaproteobacteria bacterium RBG_13_61_14]